MPAGIRDLACLSARRPFLLTAGVLPRVRATARDDEGDMWGRIGAVMVGRE